jgi:hypothetical protein
MYAKLMSTVIAFCAGLFGFAATAEASLIADNFTRTGVSEALSAPFTVPATSTTNSYGGLVEIIVSGTGFSLFSNINDAFYGTASGTQFDPQFYQLNIGWSGFAQAPFASDAHNIDNFIVFIDGVGAVTPVARPAYAANNTYRFVIEVPLNVGALQFGVADGDYGDNGGSYALQVFQLIRGAAQPAPEPAALSLLCVGLLGLATSSFAGAGRRRRASGERS